MQTLAHPPPQLPTLLVVDDDPAMCSLIADIGTAAGFAPQRLTDPTRLDSIDHSTIAAITLDLSMPQVDGVEVLQRLAAAGVRARIILLSGVDSGLLTSVYNLGRAEGLDMAGHLTKPVRAADLITLLKAARDAAQASVQAPHGPSVSPAEVRAAIDLRQLCVYLQPQVRLSDGACVGMEALVRWVHPVHGMLYPDSFIPIVEAQGWGLDLTEQVLAMTLAHCARLHQLNGLEPVVSVNLPADALTDLSFPDRVSQALDAHGMSPAHLAFELTETSIAREPVHALHILTRLRLKGIRLSIDDFGVGYSSLQQLRNLPVTELKIDKQFTQEMTHSASAATIVRSTIELGRDLGLRVLAEGVETEAAWWHLRYLGCEFAQGYYIGRPMPPERILPWCQQWTCPTRAEAVGP